MYPGGLKETPYKDMMDRNPDHVRLQISCRFLRVNFPNIDYSPSRLWHVAQEQTAGQTSRTAEDIPRTTYGQSRGQCLEKLG